MAIKRLPWVTGILVFLILTLPWYIWAEITTPGFIEYFILGEHIQRFLVSGWQGDLYGTAHVKPRGMIWVYWLICASPWSFVAIGILVKKYRGRTSSQSELFQSKLTENKLTPNKSAQNNDQHQGIYQYLICWMISPLLLFSLAGNILPIYVLPGFSALAVLIALNSNFSKVSNYLSLFSLVLLALVITVLSLGLVSKKSEAQLLGADRSFSQYAELYYWKKRPFSAQFYSKGQAELLESKERLHQLLSSDKPFYIALKHKEYEILQQTLMPNCVAKSPSENRLLLKCH